MPSRYPDAYKNVLLTAMDSAHEGITISDATLPDNPLIYVNKGFLKMTGYSPEEVLHKNCRFLQGAERSQEAVERIRSAVREGVAVQVEFLNFHKNGTPFYNRLSITPVYDADKKLTHFIGVQEDVTALRQKEKAEAEYLRQRLISEAAAQAQEQEREAIGKELHDNINQLLATSRLLLNVATDDASERMELTAQSSQLIDEAIEEIRKLSKRLVQAPPQVESLRQSLQRLADRMKPALPFELYFEQKFDEASLSDTQKLMLYRIVQEGITNCIKYANPSTVTIALNQTNCCLNLIIEDDGVGFDTTQIAGGIGLQNMRQRVEAEGSSLQVLSAPGKGCRIAVSVPVK